MRMNRKLRNFSLATAASLLTQSVYAIDSVSVEVGEGNMSSIYKLAAQNSLGSVIPFYADTELSSCYEFSVANIDEQKYRGVTDSSHSITDFGLTPAVRWYAHSGYGPYAELGVGLNYMTEKINNNDRVTSTHFQFGDHIGAGYRFSNKVDLLLKFQHYSNADIRKPNPAVNFVMLKLTYAFN
jgi:lipid A 3-O-deacylase